MIKDYTSILQYLETLAATANDYILINTGGNNKKIKISNFISSLGLGGGGGPSTPILPQVNLRIYPYDYIDKINPLKIYFYPTADNNEFLNHNPQIWLFKLLPKIRKGYRDSLGIYQYKWRPKHWGHPASSNKWGRGPIFNDKGQLIYEGNSNVLTEWNISPGQKAYDFIPEFTPEINKFFYSALLYQDATIPGAYTKKAKSLLFFFRVVMPDPANPNRLLMGPPSQIMKARPRNQGGGSNGIILSEYIYKGL